MNHISERTVMLLPEPARVPYRLTSPLFDYQGMVVSAAREQDAVVTAVRDIHGRPTATGTLRNAS